ncbi:MAG: serine/threonine-protein kinase [Candidatus Dormibacteria bacterium]
MTDLANYEVLGTLGTGATGTVYLARETALDREVALKELSPALAGDPGFLERFRAEARIMASLDHPNCVRVFDFIEEEGRAVLVSEYVRGASLRQVADHEGHLTPEQSLGVLKGALSGLAYAHGRGLVHRDIKPDNLLADGEGVSKLADFGQALVASGPGAAGGMPAGSPAYMSPEMITGGRVDLRSDIYALGAVLFEFLTGRAPYTGDNSLAVMRKHTNDPVPDPRALNSALPEGVGQLVTRAMAKDPNDRQHTAEQFIDELEAAAVAGYGADWEKRSSIKRAVAATAAALGLLLLGEAGAAAAAGAVGEATLASGVNKWMIAGGVAGLLVLGAAIFGLTHGRNTNTSLGGSVVIASPSPSPTPSELPSPSPDATPSPSPSPLPSPAPSASPSALPITKPTPTPTPTPKTLLAIPTVDVGFSSCRSPNTACSTPAVNRTYYSPNSALQQSPNHTGLRLMDAFTYSFAPGSTKSVQLNFSWQITGGTPQTSTTYTSSVSPPSGSRGPNANSSVGVLTTPATPGTANYTINYDDDTGHHVYTSPTFYWQ